MDIKISGIVIKGDGYGKKLGFPTVNLEMDAGSKVELPREGVYAGSGTLDDVAYRAGIVMGPKGKIEAHLIGYDGDAYSKNVTLEVHRFIRAYKKFDSEEELIEQIKKDIAICSQV